jgi:hypothetical protein
MMDFRWIDNLRNLLEGLSLGRLRAIWVAGEPLHSINRNPLQ